MQLTDIPLAIDVASCRFSTIESSGDVELELISFTEIPVDTKLRAEVLRLCRPNQKEASTCMAEVCDLNFALGREFTRAIKASGVDLSQIDLIASHGQTLWHQPLGDHRSTLQMAEPAVIANAFNK
jgi:1,6-anhydro-N-acetylmuramate kinase